MILRTLKNKLYILTTDVEEFFGIDGYDASSIVNEYTDIGDRIEDVLYQELNKARKNIIRKKEIKAKKLEREYDNKKESKKKKIIMVNDKNTGNNHNKYSTKSASREIASLFNAMLERKELKNTIRTVPITLEKDGRTSIMVVDDNPIMKLNLDGQGTLTLKLSSAKQAMKVFRFVILPLIDVINEYFEDADIRISNNKKNKSLSLNIKNTIYVSSRQIQNKPVKIGQTIHFTNLEQGKFIILGE